MTNIKVHRNPGLQLEQNKWALKSTLDNVDATKGNKKAPLSLSKIRIMFGDPGVILGLFQGYPGVIVGFF